APHAAEFEDDLYVVTVAIRPEVNEQWNVVPDHPDAGLRDAGDRRREIAHVPAFLRFIDKSAAAQFDDGLQIVDLGSESTPGADCDCTQCRKGAAALKRGTAIKEPRFGHMPPFRVAVGNLTKAANHTLRNAGQRLLYWCQSKLEFAAAVPYSPASDGLR